MIRYAIIFVIGLLIGLLAGLGSGIHYTYQHMHSSLLVQTHWANAMSLIAPLDRDSLYIRNQYWDNGKPSDNGKLSEFIMGMTVSDLTNVICARRILTDFQLKQLHRIINKIRTKQVVKGNYWISHYSKITSPIFNGNVENRKTYFNICNVFKYVPDNNASSR